MVAEKYEGFLNILEFRTENMKIKNSKLTKSMKGVFAKKNTEPKKTLKEVRIDNISEFKEGNEFGIEIFEKVKFVDEIKK